MSTSSLGRLVLLAGVFAAGVFVRDVLPDAVAHAQAAGKVYELRTYTVPEDRLGALHARFRDHTLRLFEKHGISNVAYFSPQDPELAKTTLVYLIAHPSRDAATANWAAFGKDPEWQKVAAASGVGRVQIERQFLDPTAYSPMK